MLPLAVAVRVVIADAVPIFKTPVVPCVNPPVPDNAVVAVTVPLFVNTPGDVTVNKVADVNVPLFAYEPVNVGEAIVLVVVPPIVLVAPEKVCVPVLAV